MKNLRQIIRYTSHLKPFFVIIGIMSVVTALLNLTTPFIVKVGTDWVVAIVAGKADFTLGPLIGIVGALVAVALLTTVAGDIGGYFGDQVSIRARRQLSKRYYQHLLSLPQQYYDGEITGKIINRLSRAIADITQFLQFFSNNLLQMLLTMAITIGILVWYSWPLAVLFLFLIPANLYLTARTSVKWQKLETEKNTHFDTASGRFAEVVSQMRLVKSFGTEKRELTKFDDEMSHMIGLTKRQSRYWHVMNAERGAIFGVLFGAIYGLLFYETARGNFTVGDMVMLITLIQQGTFPLRNLSYFVDTYQRAVANSKDYITAMNEKPEEGEATANILTVKKGQIEYRNVDFSYARNKQVLHDVNFRLPAGKKLALVGESGGGKTTISNLLMRLYEPDAGEVLIDGQPVINVTRASVRASIATVFQEAPLFSGTIRENITYGRPDAADKEIEAAARMANAHEFIAKFPDGYDTEIGERGIKLSGGQKQRIAIARAILKDAPILVLDEATSSLDSKAEKVVQEALDRLMKNRTTLIIAHRLSTIAHVDTIVTLKDGRVDEVGTPRELAKTGGIYAQLLELQLGTTEKAKAKLRDFDIAA
ncbi:ABC transporter-related protein [Candidatus Saccharibacteria bacterium RAAC3_TM7_1]|nr:ABC transporter-related protein [Candidatus Saccharibacteria bacterium RAAC3_TM7_1]HCZ28871.1 ABC transporter ATP-binding protein [Candidatus Saccharibacteria bacterium]